MLESLYKMQVEYVLHVYVQEKTFGDKNYDYCRLKLMTQRHREQKIKDSHFKAKKRDEDRPALGAPKKQKAKGKVKHNAKKNSERGDCIRSFSSKGLCSFGEACAFKHYPNKKVKGKGQPRSLSPTGSPHRNSKGDGKGDDDDGKGDDDGGAKGTHKFIGKCP